MKLRTRTRFVRLTCGMAALGLVGTAAAQTTPDSSGPDPSNSALGPSTSAPAADTATSPPLAGATGVQPVRVETEARPSLRAGADTAKPAEAVPEKPATTDHHAVVRRWGLGWLGVSDIPVAVAQPTGSAASPGLSPNDRVDSREVSAPIIGLRYWLNDLVAIEPGFGFHYSTGSVQSELGDVSKQVDKQPTTGLIAHLGVPLALGVRQHMTLVLVPEAHVGFAWSKAKALFDELAPPDAALYGSRIDAGAHAGAEVQFGFMGLEALALEASIGCYYSFRRVSAAAGNQKVTDTSVVIATSSLTQPWDFFSSYGRVAARYYF